MQTLTVELGDRSYPIYIGTGVLSDERLFKSAIRGEKVAIVTNETVGPLYLDKVKGLLSGLDVLEIVLPDGEQYKTLEYLNKIFDALLQAHCNRDVTLIALGGGVIGDMTGFAAATYQRGVDFIQVPTTLLSQVDSSVGGKTGVNHALGKNMIGAFYQPRAVFIDIDTLDSLADNELSAGLAEVIKYGLIVDAGFFGWLEQHIDDLVKRDKAALEQAIVVSCKTKADVVAKDERESGVRALLNLGHTFGHAIEAGMGYGAWLHGEAVAAGMVMAADLSQRLGWLSSSDVDRVRKLISQARLPVNGPTGLAVDTYLDLMAVDKKVQQGKMRFVLMRSIGNAVVTADVDPQQLQKTLEACRDN
jgi:3-dehydroquinate synthase